MPAAVSVRQKNSGLSAINGWTTFLTGIITIGQWPRYGNNRETMMIGREWTVENAPFDDERQFWAEFPGDPGLGLM